MYQLQEEPPPEQLSQLPDLFFKQEKICRQHTTPHLQNNEAIDDDAIAMPYATMSANAARVSNPALSVLLISRFDSFSFQQNHEMRGGVPDRFQLV